MMALTVDGTLLIGGLDVSLLGPLGQDGFVKMHAIGSGIFRAVQIANQLRNVSVQGDLEVEPGTLDNLADGVPLANDPTPGRRMTLAESFMGHAGVALTTNGGVMVLSTTTGDGSWRADGGEIQGKRAEIGTCGTLTADDGGHLRLENTRFRASRLRIGPTGSLHALLGTSFGATDTHFMLTRGLVIETQDEAASNVSEGLSSTVFTFYGGAAAGGCAASTGRRISAIEVAGTDFGANPGVFFDNFEIPRLIVGAGAAVQLADVVDNGNRNGPSGPDEALYVRTLESADVDGRLFTNHLPFYHQNLIGDPAQIVVSEPEIAHQLLATLGAMALLRRTRVTRR